MKNTIVNVNGSLVDARPVLMEFLSRLRSCRVGEWTPTDHRVSLVMDVREWERVKASLQCFLTLDPADVEHCPRCGFLGPNTIPEGACSTCGHSWVFHRRSAGDPFRCYCGCEQPRPELLPDPRPQPHPEDGAR